MRHQSPDPHRRSLALSSRPQSNTSPEVLRSSSHRSVASDPLVAHRRTAVRESALVRVCCSAIAARPSAVRCQRCGSAYTPVVYACQRWELEELISRELPARLHSTAIYATCGLIQEQSAILQGVTARTVRSRLAEIRKVLDPQSNVYAIIYEALLSCLDKPRGAQSQLELAG